MMRTITLALLLTLMIGIARADDWPAPQVREVFSADRGWFVRVTPGARYMHGNVGVVEESIAEFYRRADDKSYRLAARTALLHPIAPVEFFVSNEGRLVTLDNWGTRGYGPVIAVYAANAKLVKSYILANIFTAEEIEAFSHSVSSIHWHKGPAYINKDQKTFYLMIKDGDDLIVGLETGRFAYCRTRGPSYLCRNNNDARKWGAYTDVAPDS